MFKWLKDLIDGPAPTPAPAPLLAPEPGGLDALEAEIRKLDDEITELKLQKSVLAAQRREWLAGGSAALVRGQTLEVNQGV